ncbi:MAG: Bacitracin transport permease, PAP2 [Parcubacteria group bacterium Gr01-1014_29]|nr:MAG: Bacitracin transport permease, PAP2 [Parcubacteria group bacterium Gr01-1014_29]
MTLDVTLLYFLNNLTGRSQVFDALTVFLASYLQYVLIAAFLLLLYVSAYSKQEKLALFLTATLSMVIARLGVTEIIRFFYHRPRPFLAYQLHQLISENKWSFPSGHSAFFFAMATAIYLYNKKWGIGFFIAAMVMNISRIVAGVHYPSDILGGMIVGMVVAYVVFYIAERKKTVYI